MTTKYLLSVAAGIVGGIVLFAPFNVFAAEIIFKVIPNNSAIDEVTIIEVLIDSQSKDLNGVEGTVNFQETNGAVISSVLVENGGSVLSLWPVEPKYSVKEKTIHFAGGNPKSFSHEGLLFRVRLFASQPGEVKVSWVGGQAYLGDGRGTKENIYSRSITATLIKSESGQAGQPSIDSAPPKFEAVEVGQDSSVFDGKYFISFHATDNISGLARYEVSEDGEVTTVSGGVYVLKDQERNAQVTITAYDKAGNSKTINVSTKDKGASSFAITILILIILMFVSVFYGYKKFIKK